MSMIKYSLTALLYVAIMLMAAMIALPTSYAKSDPSACLNECEDEFRECMKLDKHKACVEKLKECRKHCYLPDPHKPKSKSPKRA